MQVAPYENVAKGLASLGRYEDDYIVHAAEGETVIPKEVFDENPALKASLFKQMRAIGIENPERYVVGNALNSINPDTGQPEFFLKKVGKVLKKAAPMIGSVVGFAIGGPAGAAIGSGLGSLASGRSPEEALINAGLSFAGAKYLGPMADKAFGGGAPLAGQMGPTSAGALGNVLPSGVASALPPSIANLGVGSLAAAALAPMAGKSLMDMFKPEEVAQPDRRDVVSEYYAAVARGENPPLPAELTPPPQSSLMDLGPSQITPSSELPALGGILSNYNAVPRDVFGRPMFMRAMATGGYVTGPGGPTDDQIPTLLSNTEFVMTGKAVAGADPSGQNNPDKGAKVMMGIMRAFEKDFDENARAMA